MIKIYNPDFAKEVKKELRKKSNGFNKVVVEYQINNDNKRGLLTISIWDSFTILKKFETEITFFSRKCSMGLHDGKQIRRVCFSLYPTDAIFDIITQDHYIECYQNAYGWDFRIQDKEPNYTSYHISMITFYNAKRSKSSRIQENCFYGYEIINTYCD